MPILKNQRHELFAQYVADGMTATKAYEKAGYSPHRQAAHRLLTNVDVAERIEELKQSAANEAEIDRAFVLNLVQDIIDDARKAGQYGPAMTGAIKLGVDIGMFVERSKSEHSFRGDPADLDRARLIAIAKKANGHASASE